MANHRPDPSSDDLLRVHTVLWLALLGGVATYTAVTYVVVTVVGIQPTAAIPARALTWATALAVVLLGAGIAVIRRSEEPASSLVPSERVRRYLGLRLVGLAIQEGAGLLVITLALLTAQATWAAAAGIATVAVMSLARPSKDHIDRMTR